MSLTAINSHTARWNESQPELARMKIFHELDAHHV